MVYLETHSTDPYYNLAFEEYVFTKMDHSEEYFMLWQNSKAIIVGQYQNTAEEINQEYVDAHGIRVARRLSGGGAVYHDLGNLNYTLIVDQGAKPDYNFSAFAVPVLNTLKRLGVDAEFTGRNDLTIGGKKFSGSSQNINFGRILHHGCIMLDSNLVDVSEALNVKEAKFSSKSIKSVRSRVTTINANAPTPITMETFKMQLKREILNSGTTAPMELADTQLAEVRDLRDRKYATWEWNYGKSPSYDVKKERKFDAGLVTAYLSVEHGQIQKVCFCGDFFGNGDIEDLEQALRGVHLDETLPGVLSHLNIGWYMCGFRAEDIYNLLLY